MTDDPFVAHRSLLFTVAYEMLGSAADAEDVVQETWLRWDRSVTTGREVRDPRAYLVRIVTRQALNRLRTLARRREEYVGEWLPEPLLTTPDVAEDVELAESVSIAMLTVLETLTPDRARGVRAARGLRPARTTRSPQAVDKSPAAVRQIAHRAREHVAARRPRMEVDRREQQQVVERFLAAVTESATCRGCWTCSRPTSCSSPTAAAWWRRPGARSCGAEKVVGLLSKFRATRARARGSRRCGSTARSGARIVLDGELDTVDQLRASRTAGSPGSTPSATRQARSAGRRGRAHPLTSWGEPYGGGSTYLALSGEVFTWRSGSPPASSSSPSRSRGRTRRRVAGKGPALNE